MGETRPGPADPLQDVTAEVERLVAAAGWGQPPRVFALVDTSQLPVEAPVTVESLTAVEHPLPPEEFLENTLRRITWLTWPTTVRGCAIVHELPSPGVENATSNPDRRLAVAVLRDGSRAAVVRRRDTSDPDNPVLTGQDIAPELVEALLASLR